MPVARIGPPHRGNLVGDGYNEARVTSPTAGFGSKRQLARLTGWVKRLADGVHGEGKGRLEWLAVHRRLDHARVALEDGLLGDLAERLGLAGGKAELLRRALDYYLENAPEVKKA